MCMQLLLECSVGVNEFGLIDAAVQVVYFLASFLSRPSINYRDRVLKPPDIVVECPISPINFVKFCCMYFEALNFCASKFTLVISPTSVDAFVIIKCPILSLGTLSVLKVYFVCCYHGHDSTLWLPNSQ